MKIQYFILCIFLFLIYKEIYTYKNIDKLVQIDIRSKDITKTYYIKFSEKNNKNSFEIYDKDY